MTSKTSQIAFNGKIRLEARNNVQGIRDMNRYLNVNLAFLALAEQRSSVFVSLWNHLAQPYSHPE